MGAQETIIYRLVTTQAPMRLGPQHLTKKLSRWVDLLGQPPEMSLSANMHYFSKIFICGGLLFYPYYENVFFY